MMDAQELNDTPEGALLWSETFAGNTVLPLVPLLGLNAQQPLPLSGWLRSSPPSCVPQ